MAIPSVGKISIIDIRTELQNTGTNNFSLTLAGRPTTGAPGTGQSPIYVPINQSSSSIPLDSPPYSVSEWRRYNHSENIGCRGEDFILTAGYCECRNISAYISQTDIDNAVQGQVNVAFTTCENFYTNRSYNVAGTYSNIACACLIYYVYYMDKNTFQFVYGESNAWYSGPCSLGITPSVLLQEYNVSQNTLSGIDIIYYTDIVDDIAITREKLFYWDSSTGKLKEHSITTSPLSVDEQLTRQINISGSVKGLFAKSNNSIVYWETIGSTTYIREADVTTTTAVVSTVFTIDATTYFVAGELYYYSTDNKYLVPYATGGIGVAPFFVGRFSSNGTLETSVSVSSQIDSVFVVGASTYGIDANRGVHLLNFDTSTSSVLATMPLPYYTVNGFYVGISQYTTPNTAFTSPSLGTFYTYYRVQLRGGVTYQANIEVAGNSTTNHWCYIYTTYPFNNVGQVTATAWTYSYFDSSTTKTFTRSMLSSSETLHFVLYQG